MRKRSKGGVIDDDPEKLAMSSDPPEKTGKLHNRSLSPSREKATGSPGANLLKKKAITQSGSKSQTHLTSPGRKDKSATKLGQAGAAAAKGRGTRYKNTVLRDSYDVEKAQIERVDPEWFKSELVQPEHDEERAKALEAHMKEIQELEKNVEIVLGDRVNELSYCEYETLLENEEVREKIALKLIDKHKELKPRIF